MSLYVYCLHENYKKRVIKPWAAIHCGYSPSQLAIAAEH